MLPIMALQRHERAVQSMALWQDSVFTGSEDTEIKVTCSSCVVLLYKIYSFEPKLFIPREKKMETKIWNRKPGFKICLLTPFSDSWPYQDRHFVCHSFNFYV